MHLVSKVSSLPNEYGDQKAVLQLVVPPPPLATAQALLEAVALTLRCSLLLSVQELLPLLNRFMAQPLSEEDLRSSLKKHRLSRFLDFVPYEIRPYLSAQAQQTPGVFLLQVLKLNPPGAKGRARHLYIALDLSSRWCFMQLHASRSPRTARHFLRALAAQAPMPVSKVFCRSQQRGRLTHEDDQAFQDALQQVCRDKAIDYQAVSFLNAIEDELAWAEGIGLGELFQGLGVVAASEPQHLLESFLQVYHSQLPLRTLDGQTPAQALAALTGHVIAQSSVQGGSVAVVPAHTAVAHFGLREAPFDHTDRAGVFFVYPGFQEALNTLLLAVRGDEGLVKITGSTGAGKSFLCRQFLHALDEGFHAARIEDPALAPKDFLHQVALAFGVYHDVKQDQYRLLSLLKDFVERSHANGQRVVLCIDNAHTMTLETLEMVRLLSELQTESPALLQIVLFGRPVLDARLDEPPLWSLRQRIAYTQHLAPLARHELRRYIDHHLHAAGYRKQMLFTRRALRLIAEASGGVPGMIDALAGQALHHAAEKGSKTVGARPVQIAIRELAAPPDTDADSSGSPPQKIHRGRHRLMLLLAGLTATAGWYGYQQTLNESPVLNLVQRQASVAVPPVSEPARSVVMPVVPESAQPVTPLVDHSDKRQQQSWKVRMAVPAWQSELIQAHEKWQRYSWKLAVTTPGMTASEDKAPLETRPHEWRLVMADMSAELKQIRAAALEALPAVVPPAVVEVDVDDVVQVPVPQTSAPAEVLASELTESVAVVKPPVSRIEITPSVLSAKDKAAMAYADALDRYNAGRVAEAEAALWLALNQAPQDVRARAFAVQLMIEQGRLGKAEELLAQGIELVPQYHPFVQSLAHILANQGREREALERMEQARRVAQEDADYRALLAWLQQRNGLHAEASALYADLLAEHPKEAKWWLGLAISLEAQQDRSGARDAYSFALAAGLDAGLNQYAQRRLQQLGR